MNFKTEGDKKKTTSNKGNRIILILCSLLYWWVTRVSDGEEVYLILSLFEFGPLPDKFQDWEPAPDTFTAEMFVWYF